MYFKSCNSNLGTNVQFGEKAQTEITLTFEKFLWEQGDVFLPVNRKQNKGVEALWILTNGAVGNKDNDDFHHR